MHKYALLAAAAALTAAAAPAPTISVTAADTAVEAGTYAVSWTASNPGAPVDVFVAADPAAPAATMKMLADDDRDGAASFKDPLGAGVRPYFYVRAEGERTGVWTATRVVPLQGAVNFRDLGGYATADGRHVKWGQIYRSNTLAHLTADDYRTVGKLGVRLVCDLRTDAERTHEPTRWQGGPTPAFVTSPKAAMDTDMRALIGDDPTNVEQLKKNFAGFYRQMPTVYAGEYKAMFEKLVAGDAPMILHCTAGKDRTGVGSALVLSALGVPRPTVVADYAMTEKLRARDPAALKRAVSASDPSASAFAKLSPQAMQALQGSEPMYIEAAFAQIEADHGSVEAYLDKVLGVDSQDLAKLRKLYLE